MAVQKYLAQFEGVHNLLDDMRPGKEEILVSLRPGAEVFGVTGQDIAAQLRGAYYGQTYQRNGIEKLSCDFSTRNGKYIKLNLKEGER